MVHITPVGEAAHWLGLAPLVLVAAARAPKAYWWLALAFGVSFLADSVAHLIDPFWVSRVYPVTQAALVGAVFLPRAEALWTLVMLVVFGLAGVFLEPAGPELFTHTTAWATAGLIAWEHAPQPLRRSLLWYFWAGVLAWFVYVALPGWSSWTCYQATRVMGIALFGYACWKPAPALRVV